MVAHLLKLRLSLLLGAWRGRGMRAAVGLAFAAIGVTLVCVAVLSLRSASFDVVEAVLPLAVAGVFFASLVLPVLAGRPDQLDARRFAPFGVSAAQMPQMLLVASLVSLPSAALAAFSVCVVLVLIAQAVPWPIAIGAGILMAFTIKLAARTGLAFSAAFIPERRSRELSALFVLAVLVVTLPVAIFFASLDWDGSVPTQVATASRILQQTPLTAPVGFVFALSRGDVAGAWIAGFVAIATAVILWLSWSWLVRRLLTTTGRPAGVIDRAGLGWFAILPANALGAVAARSLIYWLRDRRYLVNLLVVPIAGVLAALPLLIAGVPPHLAALAPVLVMALFFGWIPHNDVAYDSTALWLHVASGLRGLPDRLGRLAPILLIAVPVLIIAVALTTATIGRWSLLPSVTGAVAALFLSGLGLSSIVSVVSPYPVTPPGESPFQQPQRSNSSGAFGQSAALLGALVLSAPTIWMLVQEVLDPAATGSGAFWVGGLTGLGVLICGLAIGSIVFTRNAQRLMEFSETV